MSNTNIAPDYISNTVSQKSFSEGMDMVSADTAINPNGYNWSINLRPRFGFNDPIKKHVKLQNVPPGKKQGLVAVGNVLILFVAGSAYYQLDGVSTWTLLSPFSMDVTATEYYTAVVPASYINYKRNLLNPADYTKVGVNANFRINGTPAALVVQDGVSQPWLIIFDGAVPLARQCKSYADWGSTLDTDNNVEYVPIGKQMFYHTDGQLFIVSRDGLSVYRSITGRPLDFMINVDVNGNKLPLEQDGGATSVSFAFDYEPITYIGPVNIPSSFVLATAHNVRVITLDYVNTIFSEPRFYESAKIQAGVVNHKSFTEILGGYAFVTFDSAVTFDAVQQLKFQGRNSIFSLALSKLLKGIKQTKPCVTNWNNYCLFNLDTIWGNAIAVYDLLLQKWVSLDITDVTLVKNFAQVESLTETRLYALTNLDDVYQMFADDTETYMAQLKTKAYVSDDTGIEHQSQHLRLMFDGASYDGTCRVIEYVDEQKSSNDITKDLRESISGINFPVKPPVIPSNNSRVDNPSYSFTQGLMGKKLSFIIQWNNNARLLEFQLTTTWKKSMSSVKETERVYARS